MVNKKIMIAGAKVRINDLKAALSTKGLEGEKNKKDIFTKVSQIATSKLDLGDLVDGIAVKGMVDNQGKKMNLLNLAVASGEVDLVMRVINAGVTKYIHKDSGNLVDLPSNLGGDDIGQAVINVVNNVAPPSAPPTSESPMETPATPSPTSAPTKAPTSELPTVTPTTPSPTTPSPTTPSPTTSSPTRAPTKAPTSELPTATPTTPSPTPPSPTTSSPTSPTKVPTSESLTETPTTTPSPTKVSSVRTTADTEWDKGRSGESWISWIWGSKTVDSSASSHVPPFAVRFTNTDSSGDNAKVSQALSIFVDNFLTISIPLPVLSGIIAIAGISYTLYKCHAQELHHDLPPPYHE